MSNSLIHADGWIILDRQTHHNDISQFVEHVEIVKKVFKDLGFIKLRIQVRRDDRRDFSFVIAQVWGDQGWKEVFRHPINSYPDLVDLMPHKWKAADIHDVMSKTAATARMTAEGILT